MTPSRPTTRLVTAAALLCLAGSVAEGKTPRRPKVETPIEYCEEEEFGTDGEAEEDDIFPLERRGLRFDPMSPPDYEPKIADSDVMPFHVTVLNGTEEPSDAIIEVNVCAAQEECMSFGADLWDTPPYMRLMPGERRSIVVWSPDPVTLGTHRVTVTLLDGKGNTTDFFFGEFLQVGEADVVLGDLTADGQPIGRRGTNKVRMADPERGVELSIDVSNKGFAPTALYAVFSIYVNRTCMDEVYAPTRLTEATRSKDFVVEPRRVEGGDEHIAIKGLWTRSNIVGDHIMSVQLFDETGQRICPDGKSGKTVCQDELDKPPCCISPRFRVIVR